MSTPFTSPYSDTASLQDLLDEIVLAYSERRQAIGQSAYTPADDRDVQAVAYWRAIQNWIETNCETNRYTFPPNYRTLGFVDPNGPLNAAGTDFLFFNLESFRAAAGLHPDGFRRATEWDGITAPEYSYGLMQPGDIIGPWVIEDLQKAFTALAWTRDLGSSDTYYRSSSGAARDCATALALSLSNWESAEWTLMDGWFLGLYYCAFGWDGIYAIQRRTRSTIYYSNPFLSTVSAYIECWLNPNGHPGVISRPNVFHDIDNYGLSETLVKQWGTTQLVNSGDRINFPSIGYVDTAPSIAGGYSCPLSTGLFGAVLPKYLNVNPNILLKWNFTNSGTEG